MTTLPSACPLDCPDACSLSVTVVDDRVVKVDGSRVNPLTEGYICAKVRRYPQHLYGPDRLLTPLVRRGRKGEGEFSAVGWNEALDLVCRRFEEIRGRFGGEAILPFCYGGSNGPLSHGVVDARLFRRLGASRLARTVCAAPTGRAATALYGKMGGVALTDYPHARLIVVWGANPFASNIHLVPQIQRAQEAGARLVVLDPRRTPLAKQADLHLAVEPGSDLAVALAVIRHLFASGAADLDFLARRATGWQALRERAAAWSFERAAAVAGVAAADLERFAEWYATTSPAVVRCGWGQERNRNGGSATAAILALPAVAGKFGVRGGGYTLSNSGAWRMNLEPLIGEPEPPTRLVNMNLLGDALLDYRSPPVAALFVYDSNALMTNPHQNRVRRGLAREDLFTVVFDQVMTDTARYADVVLPATGFLEHPEVSRGYGALALYRSPAVVRPAGEARSNVAVFGELLRRLGLAQTGDLEEEAELAEAVAEASARGRSALAEIDSQGYALPPGGAAPIQFVDLWPHTADGKIHLLPDELEREAPRGLYAFLENEEAGQFPLTLLSPATSRTISSTFGQLVEGIVPVTLAPADAEARGLAEGDVVRVWNDRGEVITRLKLSADLKPGTAELPKGLWSRHTLNGATACALASDRLTDLGGGACFNDTRVEVERLEAELASAAAR